MDEKDIQQVAEKHRDYILSPYDSMMDMSGFEAICTFTKAFGGSTIYVPSLKTIFAQCIDKEMLSLYNGKNVRELVRKYGYSERYVRNLIKKEK